MIGFGLNPASRNKYGILGGPYLYCMGSYVRVVSNGFVTAGRVVYAGEDGSIKLLPVIVDHSTDVSRCFRINRDSGTETCLSGHFCLEVVEKDPVKGMAYLEEIVKDAGFKSERVKVDPPLKMILAQR